MVKRAARYVFRVYKINRHELEMLASIATYLALHQRESAAMQTLLNWSFRNPAMGTREYAIFHKLKRQGFTDTIFKIHGDSYFITEKGFWALEMYEDELEKQEVMYRKKAKDPKVFTGTLSEHIKRMEGKTF